ncbi:PAS domain S-box-containing protein [Paenibacillaceae bacterium GAS479]|nr:PAS domain S-box-containing protein [Paenibacillaceae bacterium GAS479]
MEKNTTTRAHQDIFPAAQSKERDYGMSIKLKLSFLIFTVVTIMLSLNLLVFYLYSNNQGRNAAQQQMLAAEDQLRYALSPTLRTGNYMDLGLSDRLRVASIAARALLGPKAELVSKNQLEGIRNKVGLDDLTLIQPIDDELRSVLSTATDWESTELFPAGAPEHNILMQLYENQYVSLPGGISLKDYWGSSMSTQNGSRVMFSYYYDGTMDYIISSSYIGDSLIQGSPADGGSLVLDGSTMDMPGLLEVSVFNNGLLLPPSGAAEENSESGKGGELSPTALEFGTYRLVSDQDYSMLRQAAETRLNVLDSRKMNGHDVLRGYIPFTVDNIRDYVLIVTLDKSEFKQDSRQQLILLFAISIMLLVMTVVVSYWLAGVAVRKLKLVVRRVNQLAAGNFNHPISIHSRDEIGELALSVNVMANSLNTYTTQLKDSAEELRSTKEYLESFFAYTRDAIHVYTLNGQLMSANRAFEGMLGWREQELKGSGITLLPPEQLQDIERMTESVLLGVPWVDAETWMLTKDGTRIEVSTTASPIRDQHGEIIAISCITRNVTSRKQTEDLLRRTEKLTIVGQLAAGVAHEIRNPLTTLRGFVQMQLNSKVLSPYYLNIMLSELDRINFIVSEFLVLAKPQADRYQTCDLKPMLEDMAALLEPEAHMNNVRVKMDLTNGVPFVVCEPNQLKQVFVNVMKNGIEAMPEQGGRLTVLLNQDDSGMAVISIRDEGIGIAEEHLPRLGEPFYTSKETGNGLGLMVSQRIISNHGGSMTIHSSIGEGTEVIIRLPVRHEEQRRSFPA